MNTIVCDYPTCDCELNDRDDCPKRRRLPTRTLEKEAREAEWHSRFLTFSTMVASWSKDPSTKVGAAIVDAKRRILGTGYNGFPRGVRDSSERYADRPTKYTMTVHAEANAILNAVREVEGATIYCTHAPCSDCAKLIIQSGLSKVVCPAGDLNGWGESQKTARVMFDEADVQFLALEKPEPDAQRFSKLKDWND